jgi:predicted transcriptional regulator
MPEPAPAKKRGPKPTGTAMTSAERQRRYIDRVKQSANSVSDADKLAALAREVESAKGELRRVTQERDALEARLKAVSNELLQALERNSDLGREILVLMEQENPQPLPKSEPVTPARNSVTHDIKDLTDISPRDQRILELAGLSEVKVAAILKTEGFKCSPRTVGNVRRRSAQS